jgi:hypothetical protein
MLRAAIPLLVLTATVSAEPQTLEAHQRELALGDREDAVNARAFAEVSGGQVDQQAAAEVAAGAEVLASGRTCDYFRAGGQGRLRYDAGWQASAEQWASVCAPLQATVIELGHELEWDVRPSLLARLGLRPGLNRRETMRLRWAPVRFAVSDLQQTGKVTHVPPGGAVQGAPDGELVVFDVNTEMSWLWSRRDTVAMHAVPDATPFAYRRDQDAPWGEARDFEVRVFRAGGEFAENAASIGLWIAQLDNLKLGPLFVDAGIGFASAGAGAFVTDTKREVEVTVPRASVAIETGGENAHAYANATSDLTLAPDGYVVIDHRITSGAALDVGVTRIAVDATIARDDVRMPPSQRTRATVGGASLSLVRELGRHLRASVQLEVARSFYAQGTEAAPMQDFTPRWGTRALAVLQAFAAH